MYLIITDHFKTKTENMKTLKEQIANRCVHFTGIQHKACKIGISYEDVRTCKPYKWACLNQNNECESRQFPTAEQVEEEFMDAVHGGTAALSLYAKIKADVQSKQEMSGEVSCDCGGVVKYQIAESNQHVWAKCSSCGTSIIE